MKLKIVNKKKFVQTICIITCFSIGILIGCQNIYSTGEVSYKETYIATGETLWSIAEKEANENNYYKNKDIRSIIKEIREINGIKDAKVYEGQELKIPTI